MVQKRGSLLLPVYMTDIVELIYQSCGLLCFCIFIISTADEESTDVSMQVRLLRFPGRRRSNKQKISRRRHRGAHPSFSSAPRRCHTAPDDVYSTAPPETETSGESNKEILERSGVETPISCSAPPPASHDEMFLEDTSEDELTGSKYFMPDTSNAVTQVSPETLLALPTETMSINSYGEDLSDRPDPPLPHAGPGPHTPIPSPPRPEFNIWQSVKNNKLKIVVFVGVALMLSVAGVALCSMYVWSPLHNLSQSHDVQHRENNVPILAQFDSFLVKQFYVEQEVDSKDSSHTVYVYLTNYPCNELPTTIKLHHYSEVFPPSTIPVYMLEHSYILLHANAITSKFENNPVFFYITRTVESSIHFDSTSKEGRYRISVGKDGYLNSTNISVSVHASDYYSFRFIVPQAVTLTYNLTLMIRQIDLDAFNATLVGTIGFNSDDQRAGEKIKFGTGEYCVFASIHESAYPATYNYTTLDTHTQPRISAGVGVTVSVLLVFFLMVLLAEVSLYNCVKEGWYKMRGYTRV
ncbi:hypothetical protein GBAR_LOCUS7269 [Geodia barretti]|uniref:Uncharacterized protein n=1 Tax=Geodia barretti TaxID=519541 RepID=A0AA35WF65_GEOBA|nr:hypothetical protein GBAR_LOCUS7269 [Geodia barretti]